MSLAFLLGAACLVGQTVPEPLVETADTDAVRIGQQLRCPVCQGMPIAESPAQMAQDMMARVRDMLAEGQSDTEIFEFFVARYGEWVLLNPRAQGMNLSLWILPFAALLVGVGIVVRVVRRRSPLAPAPPVAAEKTDDQYLEIIRREVEQ